MRNPTFCAEPSYLFSSALSKFGVLPESAMLADDIADSVRDFGAEDGEGHQSGKGCDVRKRLSHRSVSVSE